MLCTVGTGNTGKSVSQEMVAQSMDPADIGVIDCQTFEEKFGMQMIINKKFIVMNEVQTD